MRLGPCVHNDECQGWLVIQTQRGKVGKGGCWLAEALLNADKRSTWFLGRELLTAVVAGIS